MFAATNSGPLPTGFDAAVVATVVAAGVVAAVVASVVATSVVATSVVATSVVASVVGASPSPIIIVSGFVSDVYL